MLSLRIEDAITVMTVGINPKIKPVTLIRIERVSKTTPGISVKRSIIIETQITEINKPPIYGCICWYFDGKVYVTSKIIDNTSRIAALFSKEIKTICSMGSFLPISGK